MRQLKRNSKHQKHHKCCLWPFKNHSFTFEVCLQETSSDKILHFGTTSVKFSMNKIFLVTHKWKSNIHLIEKLFECVFEQDICSDYELSYFIRIWPCLFYISLIMSYNDFKYETVIMGNIQTVPIRHRAFAIVTLSLHSWTRWSADYPYYLVRKKS